MIVIRCPYCGEERDEEELHFGGEAEVLRPAEPSNAPDDTWTDYLYMRTNPKGVHFEQWCCAAGCGQWFKVARHSVTHVVTATIRFDRKFKDPSEGEG